MTDINSLKQNLLHNVKCLLICRDKNKRLLVRNTVINAGISGDFITDIDKVTDIYYKLVDYDFNIIVIDNDDYLDFSYMRELRKNEYVKRIPVLIIIGQADEKTVKKAISYGITGILLKPISAQSMKRCLEKTLHIKYK